jgi:hypothetical protein
MKREQSVSGQIMQCKALLDVPVAPIHSYLKSVLRQKFLILDAYHSDTPFL